jgi:hypothetical protein
VGKDWRDGCWHTGLIRSRTKGQRRFAPALLDRNFETGTENRFHKCVTSVAAMGSGLSAAHFLSVLKNSSPSRNAFADPAPNVTVRTT